MASIILRQSNVITSPGATIKGSPLSNSEVDNNFANLNVQVSDLSNTVSTLVTSEISNGTSNVTITTADGPVRISTTLQPLVGNIYDLGTVSARFDNVFMSGNIDIKGTRISVDNGGNILVGGNVAISSTGSYVGNINISSAISAGSITGDKIATGAIGSTQIATGAVGATQIASSGVTPATYGSSTNVPVITVDVDGRITSANNVDINVPGGGSFNIGIDNSVGYALTDSMATAVTMPSTESTRYIIYSIHVTNIDSIDGTVSGQFNGTNMTNISYAHTVPVPVGSAVELLKKPKILYPSATVQLQQETGAGNLHATVTYEVINGTSHFGSGIDITGTDTYQDLLGATGNAILESVLLTNDDGSLDVKATVVWTDASDVIQGYYVYDYVVPADATVEILEEAKFLPSGFKVRVKANQADRLEALIAGKYA